MQQTEVAGQYFSLSALSAADQAALVQQGVFISRGDKFTESAGIHRMIPKIFLIVTYVIHLIFTGNILFVAFSCIFF